MEGCREREAGRGEGGREGGRVQLELKGNEF